MRFRVELQGPEPAALVIEAADEAGALAQAESRGVPVRRVLALDEAFASPTPVARFPLMLFCQELTSLLEAGLSLPEVMQVLVNKEKNSGIREVLTQVQRQLQAGQSFSDAMAAYPACFPELFLAGVRASETSGGLVVALQRYLAYQQQFDAIRKKLVSASVYPLMLLTVGCFVALFLLGYVVPRFSVVYQSNGHDVPMLSRLMLNAGAWLYGHWQVALGVLLSVAVGLVYALMQASLRSALLQFILRAPFLREQATVFFLARFYRALSLLLQSGIPLVKSLQMARGMLSPAQQLRLDEALRQVQEGQPLSAALARQQLTTTVADSLIAVGERSGRLDDMLERCARFHDEEMSRYVDVASKLLEPILMAVIGIAVGVIVVLMYMPIFDLAGGFE